MAKPYLISASALIIAKLQAMRLNLKDHEWIYLPYDHEKERKQRIKHLYYTPEEVEEKLYGPFTKEEYHYLTRNRSTFPKK
ncbi:hypothetical protein [Paludifilum halophilum]|uniref:Uncharacterized protein n=1 Tax=Paludifilum halophilum TaxID=1642702 RepID=A0A235B8A7_9BACL|nr:hypothetical protein [Paludifilum halophilum]OYD08491.1 hypothetical protein CHM34_06595 [Paludifilum halophilum]